MQLKTRTAAWAALSVIALFLIGTSAFWALDYTQRRDIQISQTAERAVAAGYAISRQINSIYSDLIFLGQGSSFRELQENPEVSGAELEQTWHRYLTDRPYIQQLRYLDEQGQERVRVHRIQGQQVLTVPASELQDKSDRYYYRQARYLEPGQVYLSPLDLNVEQGVIEKPYRPMVRFVLRLASARALDGDGMLVLNVDANYLLQPLLEMGLAPGELLLADNAGRLLIDSSGRPFWQNGHEIPNGQLSSSLFEAAPNQDPYIQVAEGEVSARVRLSAQPAAGTSDTRLGVTSPSMPWFVIVRGSIPLFPQQQSLLQLLWSLVLLVSLLLFCIQLLRRSFQVERALMSSRRFEQEAKARANENESLVAQLGEGVLLFDQEQRLVRGNSAARRLLDSRIDDMEEAFSVHKVLPELCRYGHLRAGPAELIVDSEPPKLLQACVSHLLVGGQPHHLIVLSEHGRLDLNGRQEFELGMILDASEEMILLLQADFTIKFINRRARELLGITGQTELDVGFKELGFHLDDDLHVLMAGLGQDGARVEGSGELVRRGAARSINYVLHRIAHYQGAVHYAMTVRDITQYLETEEQLNRLGENDLLRVMASRVQLAREFEAMMAPDKRLALMVFDIDRLRMINNSLGYRAGDTAIRQFSRRLVEAAPDALVARLSADSFVLVCEGNEALVFEQIEAIRAHMVEPMELAGQLIKISFSTGIAYWPEHSRQFEPLLQAALVALNSIKGMRGQISVFEPHFADSNREQLNLEEFLKRAIEEKRFELWYQPVVNAVSGRIEQFEALMRLRDEQGEMISPDRFIPLLEESGWIMLLEPWLLRSAISAASLLARRVPGGCCVAINICGQQLLDKGFIERLLRILDETACEPSWISLEVTERQFLEHPERVIQVLQALRELGIRVAVDDFGTGYSSLAYVKRLPVEHLKIDREFIRELPFSEPDKAIVNSVGRMSEGLGMHVIAEGVETREQMEWLKAHKVFLYQGYLFARPAPLESWLSDEALALVLNPLREERDVEVAPLSSIS
ncbi:EAL domain-containing protein [Marinobacterium sp. D7]|uniref:bifunctional diguanylate cyclase/phosphodiesterase n=1 Tax=Marinobacterium ramblicola TaxID=2849041 RepID=UPI001C2CFA56|nr:EAL domain-containing protein [Marinobacterium ramblicola]MBV1787942.1 EAL domain-containing protein [Marinobacterium ramblicola]